MDADIAKQTQKFLTKQGLKFKLNTKVTAGEVHDAGVNVNVEAAKGGKEETVSQDSIFLRIPTNTRSLMLMSSSLLLADARTPLASVSTTLVSRLTSAAA
jgi:L-2-hydroxyglutarate oxidase LhgO